MEFKGTKGKWTKSLSKKNNIIVVSEDRFKVNLTFGKISEDECHIPTCCKTEQHANALLVSKAPEMLSMLNHLLCNTEQICNDSGMGYIIDYEDMDRLRKLIKEATELK